MSQEAPDEPLRFVLAGCLNRDTILPISGQPQVDVFGGNLAYAAIGLTTWGSQAGLLARVGQDYPQEWLERLAALGFDLGGIKRLSTFIDARRFMVHEDSVTTHHQNPLQYFAERGLSLPKNMLGYQPLIPFSDSRTTSQPVSLQISDIPEPYLDAAAVHICPIDYLSHVILPSVYRQQQASTITLASYHGYMDPAFWEELPSLLSELTAFITPEEEIRNLFLGRQTDLWEMAKILAGFGPEYILIQTQTQGYYFFDQVNGERWVIPQYPSNVVDPTGGRDAFAGGFLAGYRSDYNPVEAAVKGSVAASVVVEGSGVFYGLDVMPGLIEARKLALLERVQQV
jgi:sugar/nucleoside kinase (ribokinase family)